jgi:hypothetical protein
VVVEIVEEMNVGAVEYKRQSPVAIDPDRVVPSERRSVIPTRQAMRSPRPREVIHCRSRVESEQLKSQPICVSGVDSRLGSGLEESLEAFVAERLDHVVIRIELLYV